MTRNNSTSLEFGITVTRSSATPRATIPSFVPGDRATISRALRYANRSSQRARALIIGRFSKTRSIGILGHKSRTTKTKEERFQQEAIIYGYELGRGVL